MNLLQVPKELSYAELLTEKTVSIDFPKERSFYHFLFNRVNVEKRFNLDKLKNLAMIICSKCNREIPNESFFCPLCGHAVFKESVVYSKSTAEFDPGNPARKPWKDQPLVPVRSYVIRNNSQQPWYPTMRQKERPKKNIHRRAKERPADIHPSPSEDSLSISSSTTSLTLGDLSVHDSIQLPTATEGM